MLDLDVLDGAGEGREGNDSGSSHGRDAGVLNGRPFEIQLDSREREQPGNFAEIQLKAVLE